ncbi:hypothetical protein Hamer_G024526 [Homarus americanus]|uniref:Uncharacterized protein n=2 Tax=Homarus americanus TaxID=6706 RepID=A0A8J5MJY4_HOMAM|nr:hypothetical protein Hamer_G024526 [Homarus americanus]
MCTDHTACFPGCQVACSFYMDKTGSGRGGASPFLDTPPLRLPAFLPPPRVSGRSQVTWGPPDWSANAGSSSQDDVISREDVISRDDLRSRDDVIYVMLMHGDGGWREIVQTSATTARIPPEATWPLRVRLLAVNQQGLVAVSEVSLNLDNISKDHLPNFFDVPDYRDHHHLHDTPTTEVPYGYKLKAGRTQPPSPVGGESVISFPNNSSVFDSSGDGSSSHPGHTLDYTPIHPAGQTHPHTAYNQDKSEPPPQAASVDPSWTLQIVDVELGTLAEVMVSWAPRGSGRVEYLLSWIEESGFVSGHLLTDQVTSELSLWPGQAYFIQVELIDSQGNAVLKSLSTPVMFKPTSPSSSSTSKSSHTFITTFPFISTTKTDVTSSTTPSLIQSKSSEEDSRSEKRLLRHGSVSLGPVLKNDDLHDFMQDQGLEVDLFPEGRSTSFTEYSEKNEQIQGNNAEPRDVVQGVTERRLVPLAEVSSREILTTGTSDRISQVIVWCVGVGIGVLLLLTLCSLVIWLLNRCRKSSRNEEYPADRLEGFRSSYRTEIAQQQNVRNQATSWTFENFCSASKKSKLAPARKEMVASGIDSASLVENYVIMLESPPPTRKMRP